MFARAAIIGRVARERQEAQRRAGIIPSFVRPEKPKEPEAPFRERCFLPCMKRSWFAVGLGIFLVFIGAIMCYFAYHTQLLINASTTDKIEQAVNITTTAISPAKRSQYVALRSLSYIGPGMMGLGVFIIILACVQLLDRRDHILQEWVKEQTRLQQEISMELSYRVLNDDIKNNNKNNKHRYSRPKVLEVPMNASKVTQPAGDTIYEKAACNTSTAENKEQKEEASHSLLSDQEIQHDDEPDYKIQFKSDKPDYKTEFKSDLFKDMQCAAALLPETDFTSYRSTDANSKLTSNTPASL